MTNAFFTASGVPGARAPGASAAIRAEFENIAVAFDKFPVSFGGFGGKLVRLNTAETAFEFDPVAYATASTLTNYLLLTGGTVSGTLGVGGPVSTGANIEAVGVTPYLVARSTGANPVQAYMQANSNALAAAFGTLNNYPVTFFVNSTERARINNTGFGINTTPDSKFHVESGGSLGGLRIGFSGLSANYSDADSHYWRSGATVPFMTLRDGGRLGINNSIGTGQTARVQIGAFGDGGDAEREIVFGGPYGSFAQAAFGLAGVNGGSKIDLNAHSGPSALYGWRIQHNSDVTGSDLTFASAPAVATRAEQFFTTRLRLTAAGQILDGGGIELGYRDVPLTTYTGASALVIGDRGRSHNKADATQVTVPASVFSGGHAVTIFNWNGAPMTIVQGAGLTMYKAGTSTTGNRVLAGVSAATVLFQSTGACIISGAGLS